ncbi:hypothetical protein NT6N_04850 [Oceaniferula spumae]|uniref:Lipoprotein n=1 Tax=Oceaniferula spumae TaxID=2979115 RepID=A0AAT9FHK3_9BACT
MKVAKTYRLLILTAAMFGALTGCATFRGFPSHGGGKRFDEEQRIVAASVMHAGYKMDLRTLEPRKIALEVTSLPTTGSVHAGNTTIVGAFQDLLGYRMQPRLQTKRVLTQQDVEYVESAMIKQLRYDGFQVVSPKDAELYLVVLVDVLGTNFSRDDFLVAYRDHLKATCELTYYVVDAQTQKIIRRARSTASIAEYCELNVRFTPFSFKNSWVTDFHNEISMLPAQRVVSLSGPYDLAPVSELNKPYEPEPKGRKRKRGKKGQRFEDPVPFPLPAGHGGLVEPDGAGLLPNMPGKRKRIDDVDEEDDDLPEVQIDGTIMDKFKLLTAQAKKQMDDGNFTAARATMAEMRKLKPDAKTLENLEKRANRLEEKQRKQNKKADPSPAPDGAMNKTPGASSADDIAMLFPLPQHDIKKVNAQIEPLRGLAWERQHELIEQSVLALLGEDGAEVVFR